MSAATEKPLNALFTSLPTTVFEVMTRAAVQHNSINLGQGFPDDEGPDSMKKVVGEAVYQHSNQYPPMLGLPECRAAVAKHSKKYQGLSVDADTDVIITAGATEALAACFLALLNAGDEVIMFDPMYDSYAPMCRRAGGVVVPVKLQLPDFSVPIDALSAAFTPKTKLLLINTPHNPTGKVFSAEEVDSIAQLCAQHSVFVVSDEVYEHLVYPKYRHISPRCIDAIQSRTIRIGSAGKTFSFTAWKVGWLTGPQRLVAAIAKAHQFLTFTIPSNLQRAVAFGLDNESGFYTGLGAELYKKRAYLGGRLTNIGFQVLPAQGTYFLIADYRPLLLPNEEIDDLKYARKLTVDAGVTVIPVSAFYTSAEPVKHLLRFCFCKTDEKLKAGCDRLEQYYKRFKPVTSSPTKAARPGSARMWIP